MKTNVTMRSKDRTLFGIIVKQQTSNKFASVSDLQKAYDKARWVYGWSDKRISDIFSSKDTKERVYHLLKEQDLVKAEFPVFMEMAEKEGLVKILKGLGLYKTTGKGENKSVYCNPYIWILLAMELNPMLYAKVVVWLTDTLIFDRIEAGSEYLPMNNAIKSICASPDYATYAREINKKVFGKHQTGMRNLASSEELKKIAEIEKFITQAIKMGMIHCEDQILKAVKKF